MISFNINLSCNVTVTNPLGVTTSFGVVTVFNITPTVSGVYTIMLQNGSFNPHYIYIYLEPQSYTLTPNINLYVLNDISTVDICTYYDVIYHPCKNYVTVLNTIYYIKPSNYYISLNGNDWIKTNNLTFSLIDVKNEISFKICNKELQEANDCCGNVEYIEIETECYDCSFILTLNLFPQNNISFFLDCINTDAVNIKLDTLNDICKGYCNNGCSCNDIRQCKCIPVNYLITLHFQGNITLINNCTGVLVQTFSNDILIDSQTVTNINQLIPIELEFEDKGRYTIKVRLTDCCGNICEYEDSIFVGADTYINTEGCPQVYHFYNYKNYAAITKGKLNVYDINNNKLITYDLGQLGLKEKYTFSLNGKQGIFIVEFIEENDTYINKYRYIIYDICKLYECYLSKVKDIIKDDCKECNDKLKIDNIVTCEYQILFNTLNIYLDLMMKRSEGYYRAEDIPIKDVYEVDYLINRMLELCNINNNQNIGGCC